MPRISARGLPRAALVIPFAALFMASVLLAACSSADGAAQAAAGPTNSPTGTATTIAANPAVPPQSTSTHAVGMPIDLTILHTNDVRGEIDPCG